MNPSLAVAAVTLAASFAAAQHPEVAGLDALLPHSATPLAWGPTTTDGMAALRWQENTGEHTLLMVYTTVDPEQAGDLVAKGISDALPFMAMVPTGGWGAAGLPQDPAILPLGVTVAVANPGETLMIPPARVAKHLAKLIASGFGTGFGTHNPGGSPATRHATQDMGLTPTANDLADERLPWLRTEWSHPDGLEFDGFGSSRLGRESILQAANEFVQRFPWVGPVDDASIAALNHLMDSKLGFDVYVQPIGVRLEEPGHVILDFKRFVRIRRHSLYGGSTGWEAEWQAWMGNDRWIPDMGDATRRIHLAPLGGFLQVQFGREVGTLANRTMLRAYIPTTSGYTIVPQRANPIGSDGQVLRPDVGVFLCPADAVWGTVLFDDPANPGVPVVPVGAAPFDPNHWGAYIHTFVPPPL